MEKALGGHNLSSVVRPVSLSVELKASTCCLFTLCVYITNNLTDHMGKIAPLRPLHCYVCLRILASNTNFCLGEFWKKTEKLTFDQESEKFFCNSSVALRIMKKDRIWLDVRFLCSTPREESIINLIARYEKETDSERDKNRGREKGRIKTSYPRLSIMETSRISNTLTAGLCCSVRSRAEAPCSQLTWPTRKQPYRTVGSSSPLACALSWQPSSRRVCKSYRIRRLRIGRDSGASLLYTRDNAPSPNLGWHPTLLTLLKAESLWVTRAIAQNRTQLCPNCTCQLLLSLN